MEITKIFSNVEDPEENLYLSEELSLFQKEFGNAANKAAKKMWEKREAIKLTRVPTWVSISKGRTVYNGEGIRKLVGTFRKDNNPPYRSRVVSLNRPDNYSQVLDRANHAEDFFRS